MAQETIRFCRFLPVLDYQAKPDNLPGNVARRRPVKCLSVTVSNRLAKNILDEIRSATNKAWILGNDRFKAEIEQQLARRAAPA